MSPSSHISPKSKTKLYLALIGGALAALILGAFISLESSNEHSIVKEIGLPLVDERAENNWNASRRALVYSNAGASSGVYEFICEKVKGMSGGDTFFAGVELKVIPSPMLIDGKYTKNPRRAFQIESRDLRAVVWVTEYENYVGVFFAEARM